MSKKIIIGIATLAIVGTGGYFYADSINKQVAQIATEKLDTYGIKHGEINYNIFNQTLKVAKLEIPYQDKEFQINSTIDELVVKGISKDSLNADPLNAVLLCDKLTLNGNKSSFIAYGVEELSSNIASIEFNETSINIKQLLELHKTERFSEKYFQTILDFTHSGINFNTIAITAKKGDETQAIFNAESLSFEPSQRDSLSFSYKGVDVKSSPTDITMGEFSISDITLPSAKYLAEISNIALRIGELESSDALDNSFEAMQEYEELQINLLEKLTNISTIPFHSISINDLKVQANELEVENATFSLNALTATFNEDDNKAKITTTLDTLNIPKEILLDLSSPRSAKLVGEKFANGLTISAENSREFDKQTGELVDSGSATFNDLINLNSTLKTTIKNKSQSLALFGGSLDEIIFDTSIEENLSNIAINSYSARADDKGLLDFVFAIAEAEIGIPKDELKKLTTTQINSLGSDIVESVYAESIENHKQSANNLLKAFTDLSDAINTTGKYSFDMKANTDVTAIHFLQVDAFNLLGLLTAFDISSSSK